MRRQGAKIDEDDSYGSFDHSYKCKDILDPRSEHIKLMFSCVIYPLLDAEVVPVSVYLTNEFGRSPRAPRVFKVPCLLSRMSLV